MTAQVVSKNWSIDLFSQYKDKAMKNVFFITGTSGSGKTTLTNSLRKKLPEDYFKIYDFDENGVPANVDEKWRQETTRYWLDRAKENSLKNKNTIICGVSVPSEVLSSLKDNNLSVYFGFIKISDDLIKKRLLARNWSEQLIKDNINWAHHLETEVKQQKKHMIIDATFHTTPEETAKEFIKLINSLI